VFVVGHLGDWRRAAAVLFERQSLRGDSPPSRKAGQRIAPAVTRHAETDSVIDHVESATSANSPALNPADAALDNGTSNVVRPTDSRGAGT
jgi:DNA (cytosine-5)-methyltransferase 1